MASYRDDFGPFDGQIWLNCAHQGPLPRVALERAHEAVEWKRTPSALSTERFSGVPGRLRDAIAGLIHADPSHVILANSASYGLHLLANGLPLERGDEVLLTRGDFPSVIYPWLGLEKRGIAVRFVDPAGEVATPEEVSRAMTPATRVFCATWVHSFSGCAIDLDAIGRLCRGRDVLFVANTSQAIGTRPFDASAAPVDALVNVGFKWLCGPYGTGFCWMRDEVLRSLTYNQTYWLSLQTADDLGSPAKDLALPDGPPTNRTYDVFGTANFFNYVPWTASIEYLAATGVPAIAQHNQRLIDLLLSRLDRDRYRVLSPEEGPTRSTLTLITHRDPEQNKRVYDRLKAQGIHVAFRRGNLRIAPHLYNTEADVETLLDAL